jgi:hypothetical protein
MKVFARRFALAFRFLYSNNNAAYVFFYTLYHQAAHSSCSSKCARVLAAFSFYFFFFVNLFSQPFRSLSLSMPFLCLSLSVSKNAQERQRSQRTSQRRCTRVKRNQTKFFELQKIKKSRKIPPFLSTSKLSPPPKKKILFLFKTPRAPGTSGKGSCP